MGWWGLQLRHGVAPPPGMGFYLLIQTGLQTGAGAYGGTNVLEPQFKLLFIRTYSADLPTRHSVQESGRSSGVVGTRHSPSWGTDSHPQAWTDEHFPRIFQLITKG